MPLFQSKHQKLILQCYPAGRGSDKKPNSSELSYLLYYVSTRRIKLEKVGKFLVKKNLSDVYRNRTGNIQVTLAIINALIKKCPDDLNVYADSVNAVLSSVLPMMDLSLCQHAIVVYNTFCLALENDFTSDVQFSTNFNILTESFINFGFNVPKSNSSEWIAIALNACQSIATGNNLIQAQGSNIINKIIPLILSHINFSRMEEKSLTKLNTHATGATSESKLETIGNIVEDGNSTSVEVDLHTLALASMKAFYSTDSSSQISFVTRNLADYCAETNIPEKNIKILINLITLWVPVQLRFLILAILMGKLDKNGPERQQLFHLVAIESLLSSSVNLVGLSVLDNIRQLLSLQSHLILNNKPSDTTTTTTNNNNSRIIQGYSNAIGALTTHIYYQDQVLDIVNELLLSLKEIKNPSNINFTNPNKFELMSVILGNIKSVIVNSNSNNAIQTSRVPFEAFSDTFDLLYFYDSERISDSAQVQFKYIDLLLTELRLEYSKQIIFKSANHGNLVSDSYNSIVNLFYENVEKISKLPLDYLNLNFPPLLQLLEIFIETFGANSTINFIPFFLQWQSSDLENATVSSIILDNFAYFMGYYSAETLQSIELSPQILSKIQLRKNKKYWLLPLNFPSKENVPSDSFNLTKEDIELSASQVEALRDYHDTIFYSHYKYPSSNLNGVKAQYHEDTTVTMKETDEKYIDGEEDTAYHGDNTTSESLSQPHISIAMLIQNSENQSIRSFPLSSHGLLNANLNLPKVKELRRVISGFSLQQPRFVNVDGSLISKQQTDVTTLLDELELSDDLGGRGNLTFN